MSLCSTLLSLIGIFCPGPHKLLVYTIGSHTCLLRISLVLLPLIYNTSLIMLYARLDSHHSLEFLELFSVQRHFIV